MRIGVRAQTEMQLATVGAQPSEQGDWRDTFAQGRSEELEVRSAKDLRKNRRLRQRALAAREDRDQIASGNSKPAA